MKIIIEHNEKQFDCLPSDMKQGIIITLPECKAIITLTNTFENRISMNIINIGKYVKVLVDTSPYNNRPTGNGQIIALSRDDVTNVLTASIKMSLDKIQFHNISIVDMIIIDMNRIFSPTNNNQKISIPWPTTRGNNNNNSIDSRESNNNANNIRIEQ